MRTSVILRRLYILQSVDFQLLDLNDFSLFDVDCHTKEALVGALDVALKGALNEALNEAQWSLPLHRLSLLLQLVLSRSKSACLRSQESLSYITQ